MRVEGGGVGRDGGYVSFIADYTTRIWEIQNYQTVNYPYMEIIKTVNYPYMEIIKTVNYPYMEIIKTVNYPHMEIPT